MRPTDTNYAIIPRITKEKSDLRKLADKIKFIPERFCDSQGRFSLDTVHSVLIDYHSGKVAK